MEAIAEPFSQIPQRVNYGVDRTKNIISDCWNVESESADAAKLQEQAFSVEEPKNPAGGPAEVALGCSYREKMEPRREKAEH